MRVVIIGGGSCETDFEFKDSDYVICADHGYDHALKYEIVPDLLIGDMDSVIADADSFPDKLVLPVRKDFTDSETAVRYAMDMHPDEIVLLGFTGTRMDHTLGNIFLLKLLDEKNIPAYIDDGNNRIYYFSGKFTVENMVGYTVSLIPVSEAVCGITTFGLDYPLDGENLYFGETRGISNVITENHAGYTAESGSAIVIITRSDV